AEEQNYREIELREMLMRALSPDEFDITQALIGGYSQREIARTLGVSQQAVAARLKTIRKKIKKALNE
ncbi:sigma factor-like helix-turn-helix DNA-binding protein, partial [Cloacibacillus porcorum]